MIIKKQIQEWLGITKNTSDIIKLIKHTDNLVCIGVDVHFKSPHMILVYSQLNGGQLRHIEANFESLIELNDLVKELSYRYHTNKVIRDAPDYVKKNWFKV